MAASDVTPESLRPLLFSIAYRMVGSAAEAEDLVQEALPALPPRGRGRGAEGVPHHGRHPAGDRPPALGARAAGGVRRPVAARAARARHRREERRGGRDALARVPRPARAAHAGRARGLRPARAVRLRARRDRGDRREEHRELPPDPRPRAPARRRRAARASSRRASAARRCCARFLAAVRLGDVDGLAGLLAADAVHYADGGGKARATMLPIYGPAKIARLWAKLGTTEGPFDAAHGRRQRPAGRRRLRRQTARSSR